MFRVSHESDFILMSIILVITGSGLHTTYETLETTVQFSDSNDLQNH